MYFIIKVSKMQENKEDLNNLKSSLRNYNKKKTVEEKKRYEALKGFYLLFMQLIFTKKILGFGTIAIFIIGWQLLFA